jgi:hypothetical protein
VSVLAIMPGPLLRFVVPVLAFLVLIAWWLSRSAQRAPEAPTPGQLVGVWQLVRIGDEPLSAMNLEAVTMTIAGDGTWTSASTMSGSMAGMSLKAVGTWRLDGAVVRFTAGSTAGSSNVSLDGTRLVLSPDFVLRKRGTEPVVAEYVRQSE